MNLIQRFEAESKIELFFEFRFLTYGYFCQKSACHKRFIKLKELSGGGFISLKFNHSFFGLLECIDMFLFGSNRIFNF